MKTYFPLVIATQNKHKVAEITELLSYPCIFSPIKKEIPENGSSYVANALTKAKVWALEFPDSFILSDDSGIEVDALNGAPGVISADWAGVSSPQDKLITKMLDSMADIAWEKRGASMVCTILLLSPKGHVFASRGETLGRIAFQKTGDTPFGYDPVFLSAHYNYEKSFSQLTSAEKNKISHRGRALKSVADFLDQNTELYL